MTKRNTSIHDIEILSAYLDGHLNRHQREILEARLRRNTQLRAQFEGLQKTRSMLRSLPRMRAPHNFTLSRQTYGVRTPSRLPGLFGAVSALSSALLIVLVIGSLVLGSNTQPASPVEDNQVLTVDVEAAVAEEASPMELEAVAPTEAAEAGMTPPIVESSRYAEPSPEVSMIPPGASYPAPEEVPLFEIHAAPSETPPLRLTPTPLPTEPLTPTLEATTLPDVLAVESEGQTLPERISPKVPEPTLHPTATPLSTILFTGEILLAGVALLTALTTLILLIRSRR